MADMANGPKPHNLQYPETTAFLVWAPACRKPTSQVTSSLASSGVLFSASRGWESDTDCVRQLLRCVQLFHLQLLPLLPGLP